MLHLLSAELSQQVGGGGEIGLQGESATDGGAGPQPSAQSPAPCRLGGSAAAGQSGGGEQAAGGNPGVNNSACVSYGFCCFIGLVVSLDGANQGSRSAGAPTTGISDAMFRSTKIAIWFSTWRNCAARMGDTAALICW